MRPIQSPEAKGPDPAADLELIIYPTGFAGGNVGQSQLLVGNLVAIHIIGPSAIVAVNLRAPAPIGRDQRPQDLERLSGHDNRHQGGGIEGGVGEC